MSKYTELPLEPAVSLPAAYARNVSYDYSTNQYHEPAVYSEYNGPKRDTTQSDVTEHSSLKSSEKEQDGFPAGKERSSVLLFLRSSRFYIRVFAVLIMIISFSLILTAIVMFGKAQKKPGHPLDLIPKPATITDHPCIVFTGVAAMNLVFSATILSLSCMSSKFRKSNDALNAAFTIVSAVGFATSMGACFYLNKQTTLENDLWKWSCGNHKKGIVSDAIDFNLVCQVVGFGWKFGLVQASLELLTFIISITAFILLKWSFFTRYGVIGKVF